jgi:hypothetical protein
VVEGAEDFVVGVMGLEVVAGSELFSADVVCF